MAQSPDLDIFYKALEIARAIHHENKTSLPEGMAILVGAMALLLRAQLGSNSLLYMAYITTVEDLLVRAPMPKPETLAYIRGETDDHS
jgi:hypothetical protein